MSPLGALLAARDTWAHAYRSPLIEPGYKRTGLAPGRPCCGACAFQPAQGRRGFGNQGSGWHLHSSQSDGGGALVRSHRRIRS